MAYEHPPEDFEHPNLTHLAWLEKNLVFYEQKGNKKAVALFRSLSEDAKQKMHLVTRSFEDFPQICTEQCTYVTCPYRRPENYGQSCKQRTVPNEKLQQPQTRSAEQAILESIPRNSRLGRILDRLDALEKAMTEAEQTVKEPELHRHLIKDHPKFCEPKNPERERDEE